MNFFQYVKESFLSSADLSALPERVLVNLKERRHQNEILVRLLQFLIISIFLLLYTFAAKPDNEFAFQPVPYVLGFYVVFSGLMLFFACKYELPNWVIYCSIILDFSLLYVLMISFHFQYGQPASFILKSPTLFYVFIFIALRTLRLEWKFVAAAGLSAAIGWFCVILYVVYGDPDNMMVTRSYVDYLTSNSILIGAEIDKIISILFVTAILAISVNGSKNLLVMANVEQSAAKDLSRFFDESIADDIRSSKEVLKAGEGERKLMAIINIDIRGFSVLAANQAPSKVMQMLSAYQRRVVPILQSHGIVIDKFMGDGIMGSVGKDKNGGSYSRNAIEAAEAVLIDSQKWHDEEPLLAEFGILKIGIGITCGEVAFGAVGQGNRLEMTVIGAPVNTAAKYENYNKVLGSSCVISQITWNDAVENGFQSQFKPEMLECEIDGIKGTNKIAVLRI